MGITQGEVLVSSRCSQNPQLDLDCMDNAPVPWSPANANSNPCGTGTLLAPPGPPPPPGPCAESCDGKGAGQDQVEKEGGKACYCDSSCVEMDDCCEDACRECNSCPALEIQLEGFPQVRGRGRSHTARTVWGSAGALDSAADSLCLLHAVLAA